MDIVLFQVDAFTDRVFGGNPAAVCLLEKWLPDHVLQSIAAENNVSETAFLVDEGEVWHLRWMTPEVEVDLCGHATLASAHVLFTELDAPGDVVRFRTKGGALAVTRKDGFYVLDFPAKPATVCDPPSGLVAALGREPVAVLGGAFYMAVYPSEDDVRALAPDMRALMDVDKGVIVTAPGHEVDFVSRFFAPAVGIPEDPVTGSAHCMLAPYWGERLGKTDLVARQVSKRGGHIECAPKGDRVEIAGKAVLYARGRIWV